MTAAHRTRGDPPALTPPGRHSPIINFGGASRRATLTATARNTMSYTLTAAATATGLNRTAILRAIKSGKISGAKDEHGTSSPPSCTGFTGPLRATKRAPMRRHNTHRAKTWSCAYAQRLAEARLADLRTLLDDMRLQRDHWQTMGQRLARISGRRLGLRCPKHGGSVWPASGRHCPAAAQPST
jgi:hypothetical protein